MPLVPRAPIVTGLGRRAAPTLIRLMARAAWRPQTLGAGARLADALTGRLQRFSPIGRLTGFASQRLLLHVPSMAFTLRRRPTAAPAQAVEQVSWRWPRVVQPTSIELGSAGAAGRRGVRLAAGRDAFFP